MEEDLLVDHLGARRDVGPLAVELRVLGIARRPEQLDHPVRPDPPQVRAPLAPRHVDAVRGVDEVGGVELVLPARSRPDELPELLHVGGLPVRGEPHHLPLLAELVEPEELGDGGEEEAGRVGEGDLVDGGEVDAAPHRPHGRQEVAEAVHGEDGRLLEPGRIEGARDVRAVVAHVVDRGLHGPAQCLRQLVARAARLGEVGRPVERLAQEARALQRAPDLLEQVGVGVPGEGDVVDLVGPDARLVESRANRQRGKPGAVLLPVEPLLLDGGDEHPVLHEGNGGVGVVRVETEDHHAYRASYGTMRVVP